MLQQSPEGNTMAKTHGQQLCGWRGMQSSIVFVSLRSWSLTWGRMLESLGTLVSSGLLLQHNVAVLCLGFTWWLEYQTCIHMPWHLSHTHLPSLFSYILNNTSIWLACLLGCPMWDSLTKHPSFLCPLVCHSSAFQCLPRGLTYTLSSVWNAHTNITTTSSHINNLLPPNQYKWHHSDPCPLSALFTVFCPATLFRWITLSEVLLIPSPWSFLFLSHHCLPHAPQLSSTPSSNYISAV